MSFTQVFIAYAPGISALAASGVLIKGVYEYVKQNRFRRFEKFQEMSARFDENESIQKICTLLLEDSPDLSVVNKQTKEVFICFMEEIAVMQNSGYINEHIGGYTFGHYAVLAINSEFFWHNMNKDNYYYKVFVRFCRECEKFRQTRSADANWAIRI